MTVRCSIVIPVHGRAGLTKQCIDAIVALSPRSAFELIVVDDASPDDTAEVLAAYGEAVRVVTRHENGGFAQACNDGAAVAGGEYLVFLNNDTIPLAGWLDALRSDGLAGFFFSQATAASVSASTLHIPRDFSFMGSYQQLRDRVYNEIQRRV